jgi:hypothetical protein
MLKVYVDPPFGLSRAMTRVSTALKRYAPQDVEICVVPKQADLLVLHIIGWTGLEELLEQAVKNGQKFVIIQYCLKSTERPAADDWLSIWRQAELVWSYYDLQLGCSPDFNFYLSPLGVDQSVFQRSEKPFIRTRSILTSGYVAESEGIREAEVATAFLGRTMYHLGPDLSFAPHVRVLHGIDDPTLAYLYNTSEYVAGLRRCEGFELPAAEGLLCGARPIVFDQPHYHWFKPWAVAIEEGTKESVTQSLMEVLSTHPAPLTTLELEDARERFNWSTIVDGFWRKLSEA